MLKAEELNLKAAACHKRGLGKAFKNGGRS